MLKSAPNDGIVILTKSNKWYLTLAYQKQNYISCLYIVNTVIKHFEDKKSVE